MLAALSSDGHVMNQGSIDLVQPFYREVLDNFIALVDSLSEELKISPHSVYIRGSISVGRAVEGLSDADLVVIYESDITDELKWAYQNIAAQISQMYKGRLDEVDITVTTMPALLYDAQIKNLKIYLKYQSLLLKGEDILDYLPEVYPSRSLALFMYGDLKEELVSLENQFGSVGSPKLYQNQERETRFWCVWLARTILRSGMALCMTKEPVFTQDLLECREIIGLHYPELVKMVDIATKFAIQPTDNAQECIDFLERYGKNYVKLWQKEVAVNDKIYE